MPRTLNPEFVRLANPGRAAIPLPPESLTRGLMEDLPIEIGRGAYLGCAQVIALALVAELDAMKSAETAEHLLLAVARAIARVTGYRSSRISLARRTSRPRAPGSRARDKRTPPGGRFTVEGGRGGPNLELRDP